MTLLYMLKAILAFGWLQDVHVRYILSPTYVVYTIIIRSYLNVHACTHAGLT